MFACRHAWIPACEFDCAGLWKLQQQQHGRVQWRLAREVLREYKVAANDRSLCGSLAQLLFRRARNMRPLSSSERASQVTVLKVALFHGDGAGLLAACCLQISQFWRRFHRATNAKGQGHTSLCRPSARPATIQLCICLRWSSDGAQVQLRCSADKTAGQLASGRFVGKLAHALLALALLGARKRAGIRRRPGGSERRLASRELIEA